MSIDKTKVCLHPARHIWYHGGEWYRHRGRSLIVVGAPSATISGHRPTGRIDSGGSTATPSSDEIFVYPKGGRSADQQAADRFQCHRRAVNQTGYDPTLAGGCVSADIVGSKRLDYRRAQAACLEGRRYTVK